MCITTINRHDILFPTVYNMIMFEEKKNSRQKCWCHQTRDFQIWLPQNSEWKFGMEQLYQISCFYFNLQYQ